MIRLTRLNHEPLIVNSDLIEFIEAAPDTVITLLSGEKVVVLEKSEEVVKQIMEFRRLLEGVPNAGAPSTHPMLARPEDSAETNDEEPELG